MNSHSLIVKLSWLLKRICFMGIKLLLTQFIGLYRRSKERVETCCHNSSRKTFCIKAFAIFIAKSKVGHKNSSSDQHQRKMFPFSKFLREEIGFRWSVVIHEATNCPVRFTSAVGANVRFVVFTHFLHGVGTNFIRSHYNCLLELELSFKLQSSIVDKVLSSIWISKPRFL